MNKIKFLLCFALLVSSVEGRGQIYINSYAFGGGAIANTEAKAFLDSAGITDPTITKAVDELVTDLKVYGLWTKFNAIYPFVGGTATSHMYNLKDPRNLNAAFRLTFTGGWTHSSTGALPNGTNAIANTFISPATHLLQDNTHLSFYSRTNFTNYKQSFDIGSFTGGDYFLSIRIFVFALDEYRAYQASSSGDITSSALTPTTGFYAASRTANNYFGAYKNGVLFGQNVNLHSVSLSNLTNNIQIAGYSGQGFSTKECAFASVGQGLSSTENANFYTAVQKFQTTLGRNL